MSASFIISKFDGNRGNGLVATRQIEAGELIFEESPFLWYLTSEATNHSCSFCGSTYTEPLHISCSYMEGKSDGRSSGDAYICNEVYCSSTCRDNASQRGHRWTCTGTSGRNTKSYLAQLKALDTMGHLGLALHSICTLAQQYLDSNNPSIESEENKPTTPRPPCQSPEQLAEIMLQGFPLIDYCHSIHACRDGKLTVDQEMFDSFLSPTYYRARLEEPQRLMKELLSNEEAWGGGAEGARLAREFCSSYVFTEAFLKRLMGVFISCNLTMRYTEPLRSYPPLGEATTGNPSTQDASSRKISSSNAISGDGGGGGGREVFGTGLFTLYSKMNHSCECNTRNSMRASDAGAHSVGRVAVHASRIILAGEEITTTYLHGPRPACELSVRERHRELLQYLFACNCTLCESQGLPADDSDDADY